MNVESMKDEIPEGFSDPVGSLFVQARGSEEWDVARIENGRWLGTGWQGHSAAEGVFHSIRIGSGIYKLNKAMFDNEKSTGHPHAELMLEYAKDWAETQTPWERWEIMCDGYNCAEWTSLKDGHPNWVEAFQYRRIPTPPPTININGFEVPEPLRKEPNYGAVCYTLGALNNYTKFLWQGSALEIKRFQLGLLHSTSEAATIHMKAITSFTALPDD